MAVYQPRDPAAPHSGLAVTKATLYLAPFGGRGGALFLCPHGLTRDARAALEPAKTAAVGKGAAECLPVASLTGVTVGRADKFWQAVTTTIAPERCLTLATRLEAARLVMISGADVTNVVAAVEYAVAQAQKRVFFDDPAVLAAAAAAPAVAAAAAAASGASAGTAGSAGGSSSGSARGRAMSILPPPSLPNTGFTSIAKGSHFVLYPAPSATAAGARPRAIFLAYAPPGPHGAAALVWSDASEAAAASANAVSVGKGATRGVPLSSLRLVLQGKQTPALRARTAGRAVEAKCLSLIACPLPGAANTGLPGCEPGYVCLDLEAESVAHARGWVEGLARAVGMTTVIDAPAGANARRLLPATAAAAAHRRSSVHECVPSAASLASAAGASLSAPAVALLLAGLPCRATAAAEAGRAPTQLGTFVRLEPGLGRAGALCFGADAASLDAQTMLDSVTVVHFGPPAPRPSDTSAAAPAVPEPVGSGDDPAATVTVVGTRGRWVSLLFGTHGLAALALQALDQALAEGRAAARAAEAAEEAAGQRAGTTMAVGFDHDTVVEILENGTRFTLVGDVCAAHDDDGSEGPVASRGVTVRYTPFCSGHRGGALVVAESATGPAIGPMFPIDGITDIVVGHLAPAAAARAPAHLADPTRCFALLGAAGDISLLSSSPDERALWLLGIRSLLGALGGSVVAGAPAPPAAIEAAARSGATAAQRRFTVLPSAGVPAGGTAASTVTGPSVPAPAVDSTDAALSAAAVDAAEVGLSAASAAAVLSRPRSLTVYLPSIGSGTVGSLRYDPLAFPPPHGLLASSRSKPEGPPGALILTIMDPSAARAAGLPDADVALPLAALADVYLGKQTPQLQAPPAAKEDPEKCFALFFTADPVPTYVASASPARPSAPGSAPFTLSLAASSAASASGWLLSLSALLASEGMDVMRSDASAPVARSPTAAAAAAAATVAQTHASSRRFTILPTPTAVAAAGQTQATAVEARLAPVRPPHSDPAVAELIRGMRFYYYPPAPAGKSPFAVPAAAQEVFLWADSLDAEGGHVLCWEPAAPAGGQQTYVSSRATRFPLARATDIYVGPQAFEGTGLGVRGSSPTAAAAAAAAIAGAQAARAVQPDRCITCLGVDARQRRLEVHLEALSAEGHASWLGAVQFLAQHAGANLAPVAAAAAASAQLDAAEEMIFANTTPSQLVRQSMGPTPPSIRLPVCVRALARGQDFLLYPDPGDASAPAAAAAGVPTPIVLTYEPAADSGRGHVSWRPAQDAAVAPASATGRVRLSRMSDLFIGATQPAFAAPRATADAAGRVFPVERCASFAFPAQTLHLLAPSRTVLSKWVWTLNAILRNWNAQPRSGDAAVSASVVAAAAAAPPPPAAVAVPAARKPLPAAPDSGFGSDGASTAPVARLPPPPPVPQAASPTPPTLAASPSPVTGELDPSTDPIVRRMASGSLFKVHPGGAVAVVCTVLYSTTHHAVAWVPAAAGQAKAVAADGSNTLPLDDVTDVYIGKETDDFRGASAARANAEACVTVLASEGTARSAGKPVGLSVEAAGKDELQAWLEGLSHLLTLKGADVQMSE